MSSSLWIGVALAAVAAVVAWTRLPKQSPVRGHTTNGHAHAGHGDAAPGHHGHHSQPIPVPASDEVALSTIASHS